MSGKRVGWLTQRYPPGVTNPLSIPDEETELSSLLTWMLDQRGMTKTELALLLADSPEENKQSYVSSLLGGVITTPSPDIMRRLSQVLDIPLVKLYLVNKLLTEEDVWQFVAQRAGQGGRVSALVAEAWSNSRLLSLPQVQRLVQQLGSLGDLDLAARAADEASLAVIRFGNALEWARQRFEALRGVAPKPIPAARSATAGH